MADITMCEGKGCKSKNTCYRYKAEPNIFRQAYFIESPIKDSGCEYYWNFESKKLPEKEIDKFGFCQSL